VIGSHTVVIAVPRWSFVKRRDDGSIDFVAPLPSPFNYGHVEDSIADDGEGVDAVVLGPRLPRGTRLTVPVRGCVGFIDGGGSDPKWVCGVSPLSPSDRRHVERFFRRYAVAKGMINGIRGKMGETRYLGWL